MVEHVFVGELLRTLWINQKRDIEILRAEVDAAGYDLVLESSGTIRHVQLKTSYLGSKTASVEVNGSIAKKPCGCIIWILFDPTTLRLASFRWYGGKPKEQMPPLGDRIARHTRADSTGKKGLRQNVRVLSKTKFEELDTMDELVKKLFG